MFICDRGTGAQQFRRLVMSEIHRRRPWRYKFEFSFLGNDRRPSQKSGTRRENRNAPDSPDLSPSISGDRGYLRFRVFISRQNLGRLGNSKIPDRLGFSRHMKTRLFKIHLCTIWKKFQFCYHHSLSSAEFYSNHERLWMSLSVFKYIWCLPGMVGNLVRADNCVDLLFLSSLNN